MQDKLGPRLIKGEEFNDHRGKINSVNNLDLTGVCRFYTVTHPDVNTLRGWRAHRIEQRWFYVTVGNFSVKIVKITNWETPDPLSEQLSFDLAQADNCVLHVPTGYATLLQARTPNSTVLLFADSFIADSKKDDYLYPVNYFK